MTKMEPLVVTGELITLTPEERIQFYVQTCQHMGLDYLSRPLQYFEQIDRNGKRNLILYALRAASAQLRKLYNLSVTLSPAEFSRDAVIYTATVTNSSGSSDSAVGAESLKDLQGKEYADRIMAAQTKAKRRAILDFVGSSLLDESEIEGMRGTVVEVTEEQLKNYVPPPPAPTVVNSAPAVEVTEEKKVDRRDPSNFPSIDPEVVQAANELTDGLVAAVKPLFDALRASQDDLMARLNVYRKDVLQRGGMKPSKGFGIAAKWSKFIAKKAPNKTIEEYDALLTLLDQTLKINEAAVVNLIEQEIA